MCAKTNRNNYMRILYLFYKLKYLKMSDWLYVIYLWPRKKSKYIKY